jgi:hypothetical protein
MCQGKGQFVAADEEQAAQQQEQQVRPTSSLHMNGQLTETHSSQMSGDFKRALDIVVPATLVIK